MIWNPDAPYYFNLSSNIQMTNHYDDFWTRNIFCLGYYSGGTWNKIKCSDELNNFNKNVKTDNLTYVNATLWKDFTYSGYDVRMGVRYHLKVNDTKLSVQIYGKNLDQDDIPVDLGFAWKITDIQIPDTTPVDTITINHTNYLLNQSYNLLFKNMTRHIETPNPANYSEMLIFDEFYPTLRIFDHTEFLSLDWNKNLNYAVKMYGDGDQENSYVALLINAGRFNSGQEKQTTILWKDAKTDYIGIAINNTGLGFTQTLESNGTDFWSTDDANTNNFYRYNSSGDQISNFACGATNIVGVSHNGTDLFLSDNGNDEIYFEDINGNAKGNFDTGNNDHVYGNDICNDMLYVVDYADNLVYKYNTSTETGVGSWSFAGDGFVTEFDITTNCSDIWIVDYSKAFIHRYNMSGTHLDVWDVNASSGGLISFPQGIAIAPNGSIFYVADRVDNKVYYFEWETITVADTTAPNITFLYPQNTTYNSSVSNLNYSFNEETSCDSVWYSIDEGKTNSTRVNCGVNFTGVTSYEGSNNWTLYINDSSNNQNLSILSFTIDTTFPDISILYPLNNTNTTNKKLDINFTTTDTNLDSCWWSNNSGQSNNSINCQSNITSKNWDEGDNIITVWSNDSVNNLNYSTIYFRLDTTNPRILLLSPRNMGEDSDGVVTFKFNVTDNSEIRNCSLYFHNSLIKTDTDILKGIEESITILNIQKEDNLKWKINCTDELNNTGNSTTYYLDTFEGDGDTEDSGGGGGDVFQGKVSNLGLDQVSSKACELTYESAKKSSNKYTESYNIISQLENEGEPFSWTDIKIYIDNWQEICSNKLNITLKPELVCTELYNFILKNDWNYTYNDLYILRKELKPQVDISLNLLEDYLINNYEKCYLPRFSEKFPKMPVPLIHLDKRLNITNCSIKTGIGVIDLPINFMNVSLGSNVSCSYINRARWYKSLEKDENGFYYLTGFKFYQLIILVGIAIAGIYWRFGKLKKLIYKYKSSKE